MPPRCGAAEGAHDPAYLFFLTFLAHFGAILFHADCEGRDHEADGAMEHSAVNSGRPRIRSPLCRCPNHF
jgi:hypothetical protein